MKRAKVYMHNKYAGILEELAKGKKYSFCYIENYDGPAISHNIPTEKKYYEFDRFPPFFEGLLPEGQMLEGLLRQNKIDADDYFSQIFEVGKELVGTVTIEIYE